MWEKAGVAVSVVYGSMPAESYRVAVGRDIPFEQVRASRDGRVCRGFCWGGRDRAAAVGRDILLEQVGARQGRRLVCGFATEGNSGRGCMHGSGPRHSC